MAEARITRVQGREALDSRGNPTIEVEARLEDGTTGRAMVPSGAQEAVEMRDRDAWRYGGKGVLRVVEHGNGEIEAILLGRNALDQVGLDQMLLELDRTSNKERLGRMR